MRFGLFGSAQAQRGGPEIDSGVGFREFVEYNIEAEALGYHSSFLVEHHFTGFGQVSATLNLLTWVAARTKTLRVGTAVIVLPWHNPVLLAEQTATIDLMSGGRLDLGIGKGYRYNEFASFNIPMEESEERFHEALDLLLKSWTSQERFDFRGKYWTFNNIVVEPPSHRKPHPQVWMGGSTDESIKQVAARGFNLLLDQYPSLEETAPRVALFKREVEARGRKFDPMRVGLARAYHVASSEADKQEALQRRLEGRLRQMELARRPDAPNDGWRFRPMDEQIKINAESALYGTPDEIFAKLEQIRAIGVGYVLLNAGGSGGGERALTTLRRFAHEIMPHMSDKPPHSIAAE
jgi:alkanesulfonate monooxygenase SsuD/methylene tetrahydromethanopterin reductase-like flavin-dependent oxidoreductase (luciferase family)